MEEANHLGVDYKTLEFFANQLAKQSKVKEIFNIQDVLIPMGCKINDISIERWESKNFNYVEVIHEKDFTITICSALGSEMKRFALLQGLGHYILHSQTGKKSCYIKSMIEGEIAREGLIFTLCLLMPDQLIKMMISEGYTRNELSNLFRLPEGMIDIKLNILDNIQ